MSGYGPDVVGTRLENMVADTAGASDREVSFSEECPDCGAKSAEPGYRGHSMHCLRFYLEAADAS